MPARIHPTPRTSGRGSVRITRDPDRTQACWAPFADGTAALHTPITGQTTTTLTGHTDPVTAVAWSPDGTRLVFKKRIRPASSETSAGRTLIATWRPSVVSVARYTCPIPPSPIGAVMS